MGNVSTQLNEAGWARVAARQVANALRARLDRLDVENGPLPDDPAQDAGLERLLGGRT